MFYIKTRLNPDTVIRTNITKHNVFCRCPCCGDEVPVDLSYFSDDEDFDINTTEVLCDACSDAYIKEVSGR